MKKIIPLILGLAAIAAVLLLLPPMAQDTAYHAFVDTRTLYGIPNFWNVSSNGLILLVGLLGLNRSAGLTGSHHYSYLRREFGVLFTAVIVTAIGSIGYHLDPSNSSLLWDRLPMSVLFTSLLGIIISIYISELLGKALFWPLVAIGICSVLYWYRTELAGAGDLRFYMLVQFLSAFMILLIVILHRGQRRPDVLMFTSLLFYAMAKLAEHFDSFVYLYSGNLISGHSIKHLSAGMAILALYFILGRKHAEPSDEPG